MEILLNFLGDSGEVGPCLVLRGSALRDPPRQPRAGASRGMVILEVDR
jgi:hypothetical protein